jgi:hypothetical protein
MVWWEGEKEREREREKIHYRIKKLKQKHRSI